MNLCFLFNLVDVSVKARRVTVKGPKGNLVKNLSHLAIDIKVLKMATKKMTGTYVRVQMWNAGYKQACAVTTFRSLINNMIIGVTEVSYAIHFINNVIDSRHFKR